MIQQGELAPDFTLQRDGGESITLSALRGQKVVLYFYPKDDTPGCTIQACDFRDTRSRFEAANTVILGVSADDVQSHEAFRDKFDLTFPLLADVGGVVSDQYGVWAEHMVDGAPLLGIERATFLIDEEGRLAHVWRGVDARGHTAMLADLLGA
jgi:peroxiredoxin Q/BCP